MKTKILYLTVLGAIFFAKAGNTASNNGNAKGIETNANQTVESKEEMLSPKKVVSLAYEKLLKALEVAHEAKTEAKEAGTIYEALEKA